MPRQVMLAKALALEAGAKEPMNRPTAQAGNTPSDITEAMVKEP